MAGAVAGSGRAKTISAINITPLVYVVLVLLVILMVASTYIVAQTLKVHLPKAKMSDGTAEKPHTVQLMKNGELWGLISCNHESAPRHLPYEQRMAAEIMARLISLTTALNFSRRVL